MRRWHTEVPLMLERWHVEKEHHRSPTTGLIESDCHCLRGAGYFRKRRPFDCGRPRCNVCHWGKWYRRRQSEQSAAIAYELAAE